MNQKTRILTDKEIQKLKEESMKRSLNRTLIESARPRGQFFEMKKNRKNQQRDLNANIKVINKSIKEDWLWRGRFFIRQYAASWDEFDDGSGGDLYVYLRIYDKKDNVYVECFDSARSLCYGYNSASWRLNRAITGVFKVWPKKDDSFPEPAEDRVDYNSISDDYTIQKAVPLYERPANFI